MRKNKRNSGLTLMELVIVMAVIAIIGMIILPIFLLTNDRARLRADIQSARVIQNAIELYRIERGSNVAGAPDVDAMIANLAAAGYINPRNVRIQTEGARWIIDPVFGVIVDISGSSAEVHDAYDTLPPSEQSFARR
ncbi:MAG: type II secretion system GspH family protein [Defluviitaleaceae bacterium]|nr:type II secretion system GspH family protein [Defluviitaleaceae bacterium]